MQPRLIIALSSLRFDSHRASVDFTMLMGCFPFVSVQPFAIGGPVSQPPPHASRPLPDPVVWWSLTIIDVSRAFEGPLVNILSHWHSLSRRGLCCLHSRPGRAPFAPVDCTHWVRGGVRYGASFLCDTPSFFHPRPKIPWVSLR